MGVDDDVTTTTTNHIDSKRRRWWLIYEHSSSWWVVYSARVTLKGNIYCSRTPTRYGNAWLRNVFDFNSIYFEFYR